MTDFFNSLVRLWHQRRYGGFNPLQTCPKLEEVEVDDDDFVAETEDDALGPDADDDDIGFDFDEDED